MTRPHPLTFIRKLVVLTSLLATAGMARAEPGISDVFALARSKNVRGIRSLLKSAIKTGDRETEIAAAVALYSVDSVQYRNEFVEHFPTDSDGVMRILYENVELARHTPEFLYSFNNLGKLAREGNVLAARKLLGLHAVSDGVVAEQICDDIQLLLEGRTAFAVHALSSLPGSVRTELYDTCLSALDDSGRLKIIRSLPKPEGRNQQSRVALELLRVLRLQKN